MVSFAESQLRKDIEKSHPEVTESLRKFEESSLGKAITRHTSSGGGGRTTAPSPAPEVPEPTPAVTEIKEEPTPAVTEIKEEPKKEAPKITAPPSAIGAYETPITPYKQTWWESTKQALGRVPKGVQMSIAGLFTGQEVSEGTEYIFQPYEFSGKQIKETLYPYDISPTWRGTEITGDAYSPYKSTRGMTYEEVAERGYPMTEDIYARTGTRVSRYAPAIAETGALIGASVTPVGAGIVSGYMIRSGMGRTIESFSPSGYKITTPEGKTFISSRAYGFPEEALSIAIYDRKQTALGLVSIGLGLVGVGATTRAIAKGVDVETLRSLEAERLRISEQELIKGEKGTLYLIKGRKSVGAAELEMTMKMPVFPTEKGVYSITGGKGLTRLKYFSFAEEKWITGKEVFGVFGKGYPAPTGRITRGTVTTELTGWQTTWGKGGIIRGGEITSIAFGGATKDIGKFYAIIGGKLQYGKVDVLTRKGMFDINQYGFIKKLPEADAGITGVTPAGAKSSEQFFKQLYASAGAVPSISEQATKQFLASAIPSVPKTSFAGLGALAGLKARTRQVSAISYRLSQKQISRQQERLSSWVIPRTKTITLPKTKQDIFQITLPSMKEAQATRQRLGLKQIAPAIISPYIPVPPTPTPPTKIIPFPPLLPKLSFGERMIKRLFKGKPRYKYIPSWEVLAGIKKGKSYLGKRLTGLETRGFPKGFTWAYKIPKGFGLPRRMIRKTKKRRKVKKR